MLRNNRTPVFTVHLDRLDHNLHVLCKHAGVTPDRVIAVVKDNGYGMGAAAMAQSLAAQGVSSFAVAAFDEALFLRSSNIKGTVIHLGLSDLTMVKTAYEQAITLSIIDPSQLYSFAESSDVHDVHLLVDTGMHRNGIRHDEILDGKFDSYFRLLNTKIVGVYTHYHSSDQLDQRSVREQHDRFEKVCSYLRNLGVTPKTLHCSNSGGVLYGTVAHNEMVRFGIAFHGIGRDVCPELKEVSEIHSTITAIRTVYPGEGISYNHLYAPKVKTTVVTIPVGYGDGYSRFFTGKSSVIIKGIKFPVMARVTMDYVVVDVGDLSVEIGDSVVVIGSDGNESVTVADLAKEIGTIPYEILCTCGAGMDHRYIRNNEIVAVQPRHLF